MPTLDRSQMVVTTISTVAKNLAGGALPEIVILFALLGDWRAVLNGALVIPLSLLMSAIDMDALGIFGNLMSLGALVFGLIHGAVIIVEITLRRLAERQHSKVRLLVLKERSDEVVASWREMPRRTKVLDRQRLGLLLWASMSARSQSESFARLTSTPDGEALMDVPLIQRREAQGQGARIEVNRVREQVEGHSTFVRLQDATSRQVVVDCQPVGTPRVASRGGGQHGTVTGRERWRDTGMRHLRWLRMDDTGADAGRRRNGHDGIASSRVSSTDYDPIARGGSALVSTR